MKVQGIWNVVPDGKCSAHRVFKLLRFNGTTYSDHYLSLVSVVKDYIFRACTEYSSTYILVQVLTYSGKHVGENVYMIL